MAHSVMYRHHFVVCCSAFRAFGIEADKNANRFDFGFFSYVFFCTNLEEG